MRFGRMDSRMPRKLWSQLQQDLTYSWHPLPLRMYHQDLWRAVTPTRKYEGYATKPASSGRETLIPYDT